jgi:hypothetical protein
MWARAVLFSSQFGTQRRNLMLVRVLRVDSASSTPWRRSTTAGANTVATD